MEAPDLTTPNEAYWELVDGLLAYCESKGILVFMFPAYVGWEAGEQGWMQEMVANGATRMEFYGAWVAARYRKQRNIVWMAGGDMGSGKTPFDARQTEVEAALLFGLRGAVGQQSVLFSAEWTSESVATDQNSFGKLMSLNGAYSWSGDVNTYGRRAYSRVPTEPAFLLGEPYDEEGPDGVKFNPSAIQPVRRFPWWGWLSTVGGYIAGNGYVWPFTSAWRTHLDTQGSRDMARLNAFVRSISWFNLVPSGLAGMRTLVTDGNSSPAAPSYVAAAATEDGTLLIAYVPPAHAGPISIDMEAMRGPARARWFDPTSAAFSDAGSLLPNEGSHSFACPGPNEAGDNDWVLIVDLGDSTVPPPPTGVRIVR